MAVTSGDGGDVRQRRRLAVSSVGSYGVAQVVVVVGALIRLPFLTRTLGQDGLGLSIAVANLAPLLLATTGGVRLAARTLMAEGRGQRVDGSPERYRAVLRVARRVMVAQLAATALLAIVLPVHSLLNADDIVGKGGLTLTLVATAAMCAAAVPGSVVWGCFEAEDRLMVVNVLTAGAAVANVVATVLLVVWTDSFVVFTLVNVASSTLPFYVAPLLHRRWRGVAGEPPRHEVVAAARAATVVGTVQNAAPFATRALDPLIVSSRLGPSRAAEIGIAGRIAALTMVVPIAASPFVTAYTARRRGAGRPVGLPGVLRITAVYAALGALAGAVILIAGPTVSKVLADGDFVVDRSVFVAFALLGVASSAHNALQSAGTSPSSMRFSVRLDVTYFVVNLVLSLVLVRAVGITGPVYASVVASALAVLAYVTAYARRPALLEETHLSGPG